MRRFLAPHIVLKIALPLALMLGAAAGVLAQDATEQPMMMPNPDYVVVAGGNGPLNADYLTFFPNNLRVHQGDTVSWVIAGFHNVHFQEAPIPLIVPMEVNGQQIMAINPAVPFPSVENGGTYTGGDANSGIPLAPGAIPPFTLTIDAEPGTYNYFCDIHTGMAGSVMVVPDDQEVPTQIQVDFQVGAENRRARRPDRCGLQCGADER